MAHTTDPEREGVPVEPCELSLVIPAFDEEHRLPRTLEEVSGYLEGRRGSAGGEYEILVVDDGSSDGTAGVVQEFSRGNSRVRLLRLDANRGKGHAVKTGVLRARGRRILFADADGSTPIAEIERLHAALDGGARVAIGSRALKSDETHITTHAHRRIFGQAFNRLINALVVPQIRDTQCGFKLFDRAAAHFLFGQQQSSGFGFDVEILYLARRAGLEIAEVAVNWNNAPGSKVNLWVDPFRMFRDALAARLRHRGITPEAFRRFEESPPAR